MSFNADTDSKFGDSFIDISKTEKRLVRATLKRYEPNGTYVFLKVFKKSDTEYKIYQRLTMHIDEFKCLLQSADEIVESV